VLLRLSDAEAVALDADGEPALVVARRGAGHAVTCAFPIETLLAAVPDAHGPTDRSWGIYAGLAALAGAEDTAHVDHPDVTTGTLLGPRGGLTAITNHGPTQLDVEVRLPVVTRGASSVGPEGESDLDLAGGVATVRLEPFGAAIAIWEADLSP
jgi:hypothetical protein